jgi:hypothetical protein
MRNRREKQDTPVENKVRGKASAGIMDCTGRSEALIRLQEEVLR